MQHEDVLTASVNASAPRLMVVTETDLGPRHLAVVAHRMWRSTFLFLSPLDTGWRFLPGLPEDTEMVEALRGFSVCSTATDSGFAGALEAWVQACRAWAEQVQRKAVGAR